MRDGFSIIMLKPKAVDFPISRAHGLRAGKYAQTYAEPIERILGAQAELESLSLVSKDRALRQFGIKLMW